MKVIITPRKWLKNCFLLPLAVGEPCRCQRLSDIISYRANDRTLMNIHLSCEPKARCWKPGPSLSTAITLEWETLCTIMAKFSPTCLDAYRHFIPVPLWVHFQGFLPGEPAIEDCKPVPPSCVWSLAPLPAASSPCPQQGLVIKPQKKHQPERAGRAAGTEDSCALTVWLFPSKLFFVVGR